MTKQKRLKTQTRARMERTGEPYTTARRGLLGAAVPASGSCPDLNWLLAHTFSGVKFSLVEMDLAQTRGLLGCLRPEDWGNFAEDALGYWEAYAGEADGGRGRYVLCSGMEETIQGYLRAGYAPQFIPGERREAFDELVASSRQASSGETLADYLDAPGAKVHSEVQLIVCPWENAVAEVRAALIAEATAQFDLAWDAEPPSAENCAGRGYDLAQRHRHHVLSDSEWDTGIRHAVAEARARRGKLGVGRLSREEALAEHLSALCLA